MTKLYYKCSLFTTLIRVAASILPLFISLISLRGLRQLGIIFHRDFVELRGIGDFLVDANFHSSFHCSDVADSPKKKKSKISTCGVADDGGHAGCRTARICRRSSWPETRLGRGS